jgi:hypothetical protein
MTLYLDGAALVNLVDIPGPVLAAPPASITWGLAAGNVPAQNGGVDELAYFPSALSPANIATIYGTAPNFAAYTAAVESFTPDTYYHLGNQTTPPGGRQVVLEVTDGTHVVELIPTGFPIVSGLGPFTYSWQPKLAAHAQTMNGTTTTVPVPPLILPAGYTVGSRTLDIGAKDQWSNIAIWWNSTYMDFVDHPYEYPPGMHLVYVHDPNAPYE